MCVTIEWSITKLAWTLLYHAPYSLHTYHIRIILNKSILILLQVKLDGLAERLGDGDPNNGLGCELGMSINQV